MLFGIHTGPGAFYQLMPHNAMAALFGAAFLYAIVALAMGVRAFWRDIGEPVGMLADAALALAGDEGRRQLRYLDGGGVGCVNEDERPNDRRKIYHHLTFYGFVLCFAVDLRRRRSITICSAREAPYPWWDLPVVLGTLGGIGLLIGPLGLLTRKMEARSRAGRPGSASAWMSPSSSMLFLTSLTGLGAAGAARHRRDGPLLALHLGVVFALFITMPYGKFVHGIYRFVALVRYARSGG